LRLFFGRLSTAHGPTNHVLDELFLVFPQAVEMSGTLTRDLVPGWPLAFYTVKALGFRSTTPIFDAGLIDFSCVGSRELSAVAHADCQRMDV
jgi:hypothetical protein